MPLHALSFNPAKGSSADWLLVGLHGWGANANDLAGLVPYLALSHFRLAFPEAPLAHPQVPLGRMWYSFPYGYDFRTAPDFSAQLDWQDSRQQLLVWLRSQPQETGIPLNRTVLAGFSQGGAMALDVGNLLPLAGQMILSGYQHGPLSPAVTPRPVLVVHGQFDPVVPLALAHQMYTKLTAQGTAVQYHEPATGHEISPEIIQLMADFCEDLRRKAGETPGNN